MYVPLVLSAPQDRLHLAGLWSPFPLCLPAKVTQNCCSYSSNNPLNHDVWVKLLDDYMRIVFANWYIKIYSYKMPVTLSPDAPLPGAPSTPLGPGNPISPCSHSFKQWNSRLVGNTILLNKLNSRTQVQVMMLPFVLGLHPLLSDLVYLVTLLTPCHPERGT